MKRKREKCNDQSNSGKTERRTVITCVLIVELLLLPPECDGCTNCCDREAYPHEHVRCSVLLNSLNFYVHCTLASSRCYTSQINSSPKFFSLLPETNSMTRNSNGARLQPDCPVSGRFLPNRYQIQLNSRLVLKRSALVKFNISSSCAATHY